jgi:hypothetical protein
MIGLERERITMGYELGSSRQGFKSKDEAVSKWNLYERCHYLSYCIVIEVLGNH